MTGRHCIGQEDPDPSDNFARVLVFFLLVLVVVCIILAAVRYAQ